MHRAGQAALLATLAAVSLVAAQQRSEQVEWLYYGGDQAGTKYSPLTDINADNVRQPGISRSQPEPALSRPRPHGRIFHR